MSWSMVPLGRYRGKSPPEIIVDWFFWMMPKFYGKLGSEARDLSRKTRAIKMPKRLRRKFEVEYQFDVDNRFCGFAFVKAGTWHSRWTIRLPHLDLKRPSILPPMPPGRSAYPTLAGAALVAAEPNTSMIFPQQRMIFCDLE
jgi:hypothetical protein